MGKTSVGGAVYISLVGLWDSGESCWCVHHRCAVGFCFRLSCLLRS